MAQTKTGACNGALQRIGAKRIMDITEDSSGAQQCAAAFDDVRRELLRGPNTWNFAIKRVELASDVTAPLFGYSAQFSLPVDCIRILKTNDSAIDWSVEGRKILTNDGGALQLRYVADIEDPAQWDASFYTVFQIALAMRICERLTDSPQRKAVLQEELKTAVRSARKCNAFEKIPETQPDDPYWNARLQ